MFAFKVKVGPFKTSYLIVQISEHLPRKLQQLFNDQSNHKEVFGAASSLQLISPGVATRLSVEEQQCAHGVAREIFII